MFEQQFIQKILTAVRRESVDGHFQQRSRSGRRHSPSVAMPDENGCWTRGVVVTPKATFGYLGVRLSISGEAFTTALVSRSPNCTDDHALPLLSEGTRNAR
jgi:hypothetical protein